MTDSQWRDPIGRAAAARQFTGGESALDNYGDDIWDIITCTGLDHPTFSRVEITRQFHRACPHLAERTAAQYVQAFFAYALAAPNAFSGPLSQLRRYRRTRQYFLADGPKDLAT